MSPSLLVGSFSTTISLPADPGTGVRVLYVSAVRAQNAGSKQNVLAVGPQGPAVTESWVDKRAEPSTTPREQPLPGAAGESPHTAAKTHTA